MTSNPYDDDYDEDAQPVFDEGPDEDIIPDEDTPVEHVQWVCSAVAAHTLKRKGKESHMLPATAKPDQPTTDTKGRYMEGACPECGTRTIWKKVTL